MCTIEGNTGTIAATTVLLLRILPLLVVPVCAKRFHRHYSGQPALLNPHYRGTTTVLETAEEILEARRRLIASVCVLSSHTPSGTHEYQPDQWQISVVLLWCERAMQSTPCSVCHATPRVEGRVLRL